MNKVQLRIQEIENRERMLAVKAEKLNMEISKKFWDAQQQERYPNLSENVVLASSQQNNDLSIPLDNTEVENPTDLIDEVRSKLMTMTSENMDLTEYILQVIDAPIPLLYLNTHWNELKSFLKTKLTGGLVNKDKFVLLINQFLKLNKVIQNNNELKGDLYEPPRIIETQTEKRKRLYSDILELMKKYDISEEEADTYSKRHYNKKFHELDLKALQEIYNQITEEFNPDETSSNEDTLQMPEDVNSGYEVSPLSSAVIVENSNEQVPVDEGGFYEAYERPDFTETENPLSNTQLLGIIRQKAAQLRNKEHFKEKLKEAYPNESYSSMQKKRDDIIALDQFMDRYIEEYEGRAVDDDNNDNASLAIENPKEKKVDIMKVFYDEVSKLNTDERSDLIQSIKERYGKSVSQLRKDELKEVVNSMKSNAFSQQPAVKMSGTGMRKKRTQFYGRGGILQTNMHDKLFVDLIYLKNNRLVIKYKSTGKIMYSIEIPNMETKQAITDLLIGKYEEKMYKKLNKEDRRFVDKFIALTKMKFEPIDKEEEQLKNKWDVLVGEISAGNDSKELPKMLLGVAERLYELRKITKNKYLQIKNELAC